MTQIESVGFFDEVIQKVRNFIIEISGREYKQKAISPNVNAPERDRIGQALDFPLSRVDGDVIVCQLENTQEVNCRLGTGEGEVFVKGFDVYPSSKFCFECGSRKMYDQKEKAFFCPVHE